MPRILPTTASGSISLTTALLLIAAMGAFAANSILCRLALAGGHIDALTFTSVRLVSGAVVLSLVLFAKSSRPILAMDPFSTLSLVVYAVAFSIAYIRLDAGVGALLLFGAVQVTMVSVALYRGERLSKLAWVGFSLAVLGLLIYLLPGSKTSPLPAVGSMLLAGCAWGIYSLRGANGQDPVAATASNFLVAVPIAVVLTFIFSDGGHVTSRGILWASLSGAVTSGLGYVLWYHVVTRIPAFTAATVQLGVPIFAALGGVAVLGESLSLRLLLATAIVLGGIGLVLLGRQHAGVARTNQPSNEFGREQWVHGAGI